MLVCVLYNDCIHVMAGISLVSQQRHDLLTDSQSMVILSIFSTATMKTDPRPLAVMNKLQSMDSIKILGVVVLYHSGNTADGDHRTSCDAISRGCLTGNGQSS